MILTFNLLLRSIEIDPSKVRLLRHKDQRALKGRSPYEMWRDDRVSFEDYQSSQAPSSQAKLDSEYWASFVGTPGDETIFVGLYQVEFLGLNQLERYQPHTNAVTPPGNCNLYRLKIVDEFRAFDGRLVVDWGPGMRSWIQRADNQDKSILELRRDFKEPEFPGYLQFLKTLSALDGLPLSWIDALRISRGVYLLTCPRTKEQYVGSATGENGFWGRWQDYLQTGHGGNVQLKSREASDYQVSILEVAGSSATTNEIIQMEQRWKEKLQSREMGLNRN